MLQSSEAWRTFEPWLDRANPRLAWSVARGLVQGSMFTDAERTAAALMRQEARARLRLLLQPGVVLCLPTTPFPAPHRGLPLHVLTPLRERISCLTSHGGLTGVPQLSIPGAAVDGAPVGLSVVGARPNFMKAAPLLRALSAHPAVRQTLVHTGQHYDSAMSEVFFQQLEMPQPDCNLGIGSGSHSMMRRPCVPLPEPGGPKRRITIFYPRSGHSPHSTAIVKHFECRTENAWSEMDQ